MKQEVGKLHLGITTPTDLLRFEVEALADEVRKLKIEVGGAQLITENIDLDIEWKDDKAEWGGLTLECLPSGDDSGDWYWEIDGKSSPIKHGSKDTQELAQTDCVLALKKILTGSK